MRILHIGDFHFRSDRNEYDQSNIVLQLFNHLERKEAIDFALFSGDLVNSGQSLDFEHAHNKLVLPLLKAINLNNSKFILCEGNHDINRSECSNSTIQFFSENNSQIKTNEDLNKWVSPNSKDLQISLDPSRNYFEYAKKHFKCDALVFNEFVTIHQHEVDNKLIAFVSLNSSWLSSGFQEDKGNLLFPTKYLKEAIEKIRNADVKILMLHHPLSHFKEFNFLEIQDLIYREFNLLLSGHEHKEKIEAQYNSNNGIYCNSTQATLCYDRGEIGYSIIELDLNQLDVLRLKRAHYLGKENQFIDLPEVIVTVPCGVEKYNQNRLRNKITSKYDYELKTANQLLLNYSEENQRGFIETFTDPVLSTKSNAESESVTPDNNIEFNSLLDPSKNYLIFGKDKCGKTSLLKKIQLQHLKNFSDNGIVPFYIDYKEYENPKNKYNVIKLIADYYQLNNNDANALTEDHKFLLLIDNLNPALNIHTIVMNFIAERSNIRFIVCSEYITSRVFFEELDGLDYDKLYFKDLTRKEIRKYTQKQPGINNESEDEVLEKISSLCSQLEMPINYWTISLILLIYKKNNDDYTKNLFSVLDACVDEILNKKSLATDQTSLKFEQYKTLCSQIAHYLLINHKETDYTATYGELITFIEQCIKRNPRIVSEAKEVFDYLMEVGLLKKRATEFTFRLNGIFEYFLAFYIKDNASFKEEILNDDSIFLSFKNELELYSGFNRNDTEFLRKIYGKVQNKFNPVIEKFSKDGSIDQNLKRKIDEANDFRDKVKALLVSKPFESAIKDQIYDEQDPLTTNSDVHIKKVFDTNSINYELLEKYILILSRVFKNLDNVTDIKLIDEVFSYLLECYCYLGFYFLEEFEESAKAENLSNSENLEDDKIFGEEILKLISRIMPLIMQSTLYDGVGHNNIKRIVEEKIVELSKESSENQYKLFLLYLLYIDIDIKNNRDKIDELLSIIKLSALKVSVVFKLNFYLAFKTYKNPTLEAFFKNKIQKATLQLEEKTNVGELQKTLYQKSRKNIYARRRSNL